MAATCPKCNNVLNVWERLGGGQAKCPACDHTWDVEDDAPATPERTTEDPFSELDTRSSALQETCRKARDLSKNAAATPILQVAAWIIGFGVGSLVLYLMSR